MPCAASKYQKAIQFDRQTTSGNYGTGVQRRFASGMVRSWRACEFHQWGDLCWFVDEVFSMSGPEVYLWNSPHYNAKWCKQIYFLKMGKNCSHHADIGWWRLRVILIWNWKNGEFNESITLQIRTVRERQLRKLLPQMPVCLVVPILLRMMCQER